MLASHSCLLDRVTDHTLRTIDGIRAGDIGLVHSNARAFACSVQRVLEAIDTVLDGGQQRDAGSVKLLGSAGMRAIDGVEGPGHDGHTLGRGLLGGHIFSLRRGASAATRSEERRRSLS